MTKGTQTRRAAAFAAAMMMTGALVGISTASAQDQKQQVEAARVQTSEDAKAGRLPDGANQSVLRFDGESRDADWAGQTEAAIRADLAPLIADIDGVTLDSLNCKASVCEVAVTEALGMAEKDGNWQQRAAEFLRSPQWTLPTAPPAMLAQRLDSGDALYVLFLTFAQRQAQDS